MIALTENTWRVRGACFRHPGSRIDTLSDISLDIARGQLTALLGPNGAGKSTLLHLLLGTLRPEQGDVQFCNRPVDKWTRRQLALEIGVVPQGEVEPLFSVREVVAMGRYPHLGPWQRERAVDARAIEQAMERCDVTQFADRWVSTLSGGERQRVRVARALAQEARVLVLDEPTSFLDIRHEMTMFQLLHSLQNEGVTVVLATHNLNLASRFADRLVLLRQGRVAASGTPPTVMTAAQLSAVYEWPVDISPHANGAPQVVPR